MAQELNILGLPVAATLTGFEWFPLVQAGKTMRAQTDKLAALASGSLLPSCLDWVIDGAGNPIPAQTSGYLTVPFGSTIVGAEIVANASGSITVDILRCTYAQFDGGSTHPVPADTICGGNPLVISAATKTTSNLSGWTTTLNQGDILAFYVASLATTIARVTVALTLSRIAPS